MSTWDRFLSLAKCQIVDLITRMATTYLRSRQCAQHGDRPWGDRGTACGGVTPLRTANHLKCMNCLFLKFFLSYFGAMLDPRSLEPQGRATISRQVIISTKSWEHSSPPKAPDSGAAPGSPLVLLLEKHKVQPWASCSQFPLKSNEVPFLFFL